MKSIHFYGGFAGDYYPAEEVDAELARLREELDEARSIIIEADALSQSDKKPRPYDEAKLAILYMMSCGVEEMDEAALEEEE